MVSPGAPDPPQMSQTKPPPQAMSEVDRDVVSPDPPPPTTEGDTPASTQHSPFPPPHPQEVLNHILGDLELFMGQLKMTLSSGSKKKKQKKKPGRRGGECPRGAAWGSGVGSPVPAPGSAPPALPPKEEYTDFFQKVKYALNLMVGPAGLGGGGCGVGGMWGSGLSGNGGAVRGWGL